MLSVEFESDGNDLLGIVITGAVGLCFVVYGISRWRQRGHLLKHGVPAKGIIESIAEEVGDEGTYYYPIIKFWADERWIVGGHRMTSLANNYYLGDEVKIKFDKNDPNNFIIEDHSFLDGPGIITIVGAAVLLWDIFWIYSIFR